MSGTRCKQLQTVDSKPLLIESSENEFWKRLKTGNVVKLHGPVKHIAVCPTEPYHFAVPDAFKVLMYKSKTDRLYKSFSAFQGQPLYCSFRSDGQLMAAADEEGFIKIFSASKKTLLRQLRAHNGPAYSVHFLSDKVRLCCAGQDASIQLWDVSTGTRLMRYVNPGEEQVRALAVSRVTPNLVLAGGFDGVARLYDIRQGSVARSFSHGFPVSAVALTPADNLAISAGDSWVRVWSLAGDRVGGQICSYKRHHKLITSLAIARDGARILSAGMDGLVKVADTLNFNEVAKMEYHSPLLSMAITPDDSNLFVGGEDGMLYTRHHREQILDKEDISEELTIGTKRPLPSESAAKGSSNHKALRKDLRQIAARNSAISAEKDGHPPRHPATARLERLLRRFEHSRVLWEVMAPGIQSNNPDLVLAIVRELARRRVLGGAVAGRSKKELTAIFTFIQNNIYKHSYSAALINLLTTIIDNYSAQELTSCRKFSTVCEVVHQQVNFIRASEKLSASLKLVLEAANLSQ